MTTHLFQQLGMSLGPFPLLGAAPSNLHGHFEAEPFLELNREVQQAAFGFRDEVPPTPERLRTYLDTRGEWPTGPICPEACFARGRDLVTTLVASGSVIGFKDPRTALVWPFWKQVLAAFPQVRVQPVALLRSPHEIAMSLFTRNLWDYDDCLSVTACHYRAMQGIIDSFPTNVPTITFGDPDYPDRVRRTAEACGLPWSGETFAATYDPACYHHHPAVVNHEAEELFAQLSGSPVRMMGSVANLERLLQDATLRESVLRKELSSTVALASTERQLCEHQSRQQLADRDQQLADRDQQLADRDQQLADRDQRLAELHAVARRYEQALSIRLARGLTVLPRRFIMWFRRPFRSSPPS